MSGSSKSCSTYDSLTMSQWVSGFSWIIREETDLGIKNLMLDYLADLMEDSQDFGWQAAKGCHAVLLVKIEEEKITGLTQKKLIEFMLRDPVNLSL